MEEGRGVTAKVRWLTKPHEAGEGEGRSRWIHATPLYGHTGSVGVWMIVLVEEDGVAAGDAKRRYDKSIKDARPPTDMHQIQISASYHKYDWWQRV